MKDILNFWLIRAEQKKKLVREEKKKDVIPPIYKQGNLKISKQGSWINYQI